MTELRRLKIKNFKSLKDVDIEFDHLNILIGMNGAGKSTVLQALDFVSQLMRGRIDVWLKDREWEAADLNSKFSPKNNIEINVTVILDNGTDIMWEAHFNRSKLNCTFEQIEYSGQKLLTLRNNQIHVNPLFRQSSNSNHNNSRDEPLKILTDYQGSIFSAFRFGGFSAEVDQIIEVRDFFRSIQSLELLSPNLMRKRARTTEKDIGTGGEKLSAFLGSMNDQDHQKLLLVLQTFYPQAVDFEISNLKSGWKRLSIIEQFGDHKIKTEARHMNDGLLRILAILAQTQTAPSMLLLDEIENGVNQELVEKLVKVLVEAKTQLVVTTHSPLILNYLSDEIAKKSVQFIYKSPEGATQIRRFFDIPRIAIKLDLMGAGDAFIDTNLIELAQECHNLDALGNPAP